MSKEIDDCYEEFTRSSDERGFTIDKIEQLMLIQQKKLRAYPTITPKPVFEIFVAGQGSADDA